MKSYMERKVSAWAAQAQNANDSDAIKETNLKIHFLANHLYAEYEPTLMGMFPAFIDRMDNWLQCVSSEDEQLSMFQLVPQIFYVGKDELNTLYRVAYNTHVTRWVINDIGLKFEDGDIDKKLNDAMIDTWFCPITDSLRINAFYHLNNVPGRYNHRPDWKSLHRFGCPQRIIDYIQSKNVKRIVLLEDFIGSGSQAKPVMDLLSTLELLNLSIPVLVCPILVCPAGLDFLRKNSKYKNIAFSPVIELSEANFIPENAGTTEDELCKKVRKLAIDSYEIVSGVKDTKLNREQPPYGPFGFGDLGALVVMNNNTPDNVLPLIHHSYVTWQALFPRHCRV